MVERLRGRRGQQQRLRRLAAEPLCRRCAERDIVTASTVPDHIVPLAQGGTDDDINVRCLLLG
jgi:5-methylcytosine-specific restriction protein A